MLTGTFSATGASGAIEVHGSINLSLVFGTGSVTVQRYMNGAWRDLPNSTYTASIETAINSANPCYHRLNCTAYTADIDYHLGAGEKPA